MEEKPQNYWQNQNPEEPEQVPGQGVTSTPQPAASAPQPPVATDPQPSQYSGYELTGEEKPISDSSQVPPLDAISWEASEYVHHEKNPLWFVGLGVVAIIATGASIYLQAWTFVVLLIVMVVAIVYFAVRPPRSLHYTLSMKGLQVEQHFYDYQDFRAFGIVQDGGLYSVMLLPVKRFMPALTLYFAQEDGEKIVDVLGAHLPMEEFKQDPIDRLMRNLRF